MEARRRGGHARAAAGMWYVASAIFGLGIPGVVVRSAPTMAAAIDVFVQSLFGWILATGLLSATTILLIALNELRSALVLAGVLVVGDVVLLGPRLFPIRYEGSGIEVCVGMLLLHGVGLWLLRRSRG